MQVFLNGLATAIPPYELPQLLVLEAARRILGPKYEYFERMAGSFINSGVKTRYSVAPPDWFEHTKSWSDRNSQYLLGANKLFADAAAKALKLAGLAGRDIDLVVTISSTGIATPSLEALNWKELGFRNDVRRVPVFGLGCAGGVTGLAIAASLARSRPGANVLMVALEACTLSFRTDRLEKADIIATVLFGDGAAAAVLSTRPGAGVLPSVAFGEGHEHLWPDTLDIMGWHVDDTGLGVIFDRSIPDFAGDFFAKAAGGALEKAGIERGSLDRFVCHPGGRKVLEALESSLCLAPGALDAERETLRDYGNMSSPTALFVLKKVIENGKSGQMMMTSLGPGFTASFLPLMVGAVAPREASRTNRRADRQYA